MTPEFIETNFSKAKRVTGKLEWRYEPIKRSGNRFYYRIAYDVLNRTFTARIMDWSHRRKPKLAVREMSPEFTEVLRCCLPASALALCAAASIERIA